MLRLTNEELNGKREEEGCVGGNTDSWRKKIKVSDRDGEKKHLICVGVTKT